MATTGRRHRVDFGVFDHSLAKCVAATRVSLTRVLQVRVDRRTAIIFLLLSLAICGFGGRAFVASFAQGMPAETETATGIVREVQHRFGKYGNVTSIRFRVGAESRDFLYVSFFPSFAQARECLVTGASVTLRTSIGTPDIWEVNCSDDFVVDANEMLAARRANLRAGGWVAIGFLIAAAFWAWLILSGRAA
jgi:hypothetical protein